MRSAAVFAITITLPLQHVGMAAEAGTSGQTANLAELDLEQLMRLDVIVTATKRPESVATVPISISAYSQQALDALGMKSIADIAAMSPGINYSAENQYGGTPQSNIEIRGVQSRTGAPTTALYLDDTPLLVRANEFNNGTSLAYPQIFDLDRVEVLRGPQGTLYGASAEGGAIRFITTAPNLTTRSAYVRSELSWTEDGAPSYAGGVATSGPIVAP